MGYYKDLLAQIEVVERQGFNPYTETYSGRVGQLPTQAGDSGLNTPQTASIDDPVPTNAVTDEMYTQAWGNYGQQQALATQAFQDKYPKVDVSGILNEYSDVKDFSNQNLDEYAKQLTDRYGELKITPDEVKAKSPDYYSTLKTIKQKEQRDQTKGELEQNAEEEYFGFRNLLERRYKTGESFYKYLDEVDDKETLKEFDKKAKTK